jgi:hypothetical protein
LFYFSSLVLASFHRGSRQGIGMFSAQSLQDSQLKLLALIDPSLRP